MGLHEFRPPTAFGGVTPAYIYRDDLAWLAAEAAEASRWMSRPERPVYVDAADVLHALAEAHRGQGRLPLAVHGARGDGYRGHLLPRRGWPSGSPWGRYRWVKDS